MDSIRPKTVTPAPLAVNVTPTTVPARTVGQNVSGGTTLTAAATGGSGTYTYQWKRGGTAISGATNATLVLANPVILADAGNITVDVNDGATTASSTPAVVITVNAVPASAAPQPANQTGADGTAGKTFTAAAFTGGTTPLTYQWQVQTGGTGAWASVTGGTGATSLSYTTATLAASMNGNKYKCVATDANGITAETNGSATLTVTPTGITFTAGAGGTISAVSGKTLTLTLATTTSAVTLTAAPTPAGTTLSAPTAVSSATPASVTASATGNNLLITGVATAASPGIAVTATYGTAGTYTINVIVP